MGCHAAMSVGGCWYFLEKCWKTGESGHDVRVSRSAPWMARVGDPVMMRTTVSLFIRKFTPGDVTSRRDIPFAVGVRLVYGNPTLRAMHSIHKCVAKGAPHLFHWRLSSVSGKTGRTVYSQKQKQRLVSKLPDRCFRFDYAWLVTFNLVCCKYPKNNEFRTKKFLNQGSLYGISSFCPFSENNSFLHGKISCFCIF